MRNTLSFSLLAVLGLSFPGCANQAGQPETVNPDGAGAGGEEPIASRASGGVESRGSSDARKPKVRLKSAKPVRVVDLHQAVAIGGEGGKKKPPTRATKKKQKLDLTGFTPSLGSVGSKIEVFGSGFSTDLTANQVVVGGVNWTVEEAHEDRLVVSVPEAAVAGKLQVSSGKKSRTTEGEFGLLTDDGAFGKPGPAYNGLLGEVFASTDSLTTMPDFAGLGEPIALIAAGPVDIPSTSFVQGFPGEGASITENFAIRFSGSLNIVAEGEFDLCLTSDAGSRLFLEDTLVVDNDGTRADGEVCELIYLEPGEYQLRLEYFHGVTETVALQLVWAQDGGEKVPVPAQALFRPPDPISLLP